MANQPIRVGRADVDVTGPSHISGVGEGNAPGNYEKQRGHQPDGRSTAERSTGINAGKRNPIVKGMPNLSPP